MDHEISVCTPPSGACFFYKRGSWKSGSPLHRINGKCLPGSLRFLTVTTGPAWNQSGDFWKWWQWSHRCQELVMEGGTVAGCGHSSPAMFLYPQTFIREGNEFSDNTPGANSLAWWAHICPLQLPCRGVIHLLNRPLLARQSGLGLHLVLRTKAEK